jgi:hypothetical protein
MQMYDLTFIYITHDEIRPTGQFRPIGKYLRHVYIIAMLFMHKIDKYQSYLRWDNLDTLSQMRFNSKCIDYCLCAIVTACTSRMHLQVYAGTRQQNDAHIMHMYDVPYLSSTWSICKAPFLSASHDQFGTL